MGQRSPDRVRGALRPGLGQSQGSDSLSRGQIATAVLIILGQLLPRAEMETRIPRDRRLPEPTRFVPAGLPLGAETEPQEYPFPVGAAEPPRQGGPIALDPAFRIQRLPEAAEPEVLLGSEIKPAGVSEGTSHPPRQRDEGQDVEPVVLKDRPELLGAPAPEVAKIQRRDQRAGHVVNAVEAQDARLNRGEATVGEAG